jgi:hypothetical protein
MTKRMGERVSDEERERDRQRVMERDKEREIDFLLCMKPLVRISIDKLT